MVRPLPISPRRILVIKSHSAGIGDILRSSASWATLKTRWPEVQLHLLFLTRWPGYPSEELIREHFLLSSTHFIPIREGNFAGIRGILPRTWFDILPKVKKITREIDPDLIIDSEPFGIETSIVARVARRCCSAPVVGVAEVPGRAMLYDYAGQSLRTYARCRGLCWPMDYTNRDYAALTALNLERNGQRILLRETVKGAAYRKSFLARLTPDRTAIGLNIGCGTQDAASKRPQLPLLVESLGRVAMRHPFQLLLTGAENERHINSEFRSHYASRWGTTTHIWDLAGTCSLSSLTGIISLCSLFISSDSGPYHMSVALNVPTLAIFNFPSPAHYHREPTVVTQIAGDVETTIANILNLFAVHQPGVV